VAPLLAELGFRATFFVTHRWMDDPANFMSWQDIAELSKMGFEIGNHTWSHADCSTPYGASRLAGELALVENALTRAGVPRPVSFAWPGNGFGPESIAVLRERGYRLARRGTMPEVEYGRATVGPLFDPQRRHPLLIPTTGDSYPNWTFEHFQAVVARAEADRALILQYHGVPDVAHPWVHTEPALFRQSMQFLQQNGYRVLALRDLEPYIDGAPADPVASFRHPLRANPKQAPEVEATNARLDYWREVMAAHGYSRAEASRVTGRADEPVPAWPASRARILPYPGGRHPRIGFLEGAISPQRGTKASVFLPWDPTSYLVVDLPEAIFSDRRLLFLAHTHIPTIWDDQHKVIDNVDWRDDGAGGLQSEWVLPNAVRFRASVRPGAGGADLELWLHNGTPEPLPKLRAQVCVMLKGAPEFAAQTNDNKELGQFRASARAGSRAVSVEWEPCHRVWANPPCPCMHSDPLLGDCAPGASVRASGRLRWQQS
jgi:peptidoglycan/xylan/chitin deacetylase (PgdA/CDA1 family)